VGEKEIILLIRIQVRTPVDRGLDHMKNEPATFRSSDRGLYRSYDPQWFRYQNLLHAPGTKLEWSLSIDTSEKKTDRSAHPVMGVVSPDRTDEGQGL
jgi:hypothetical protein